jgi:hypothetical protein
MKNRHRADQSFTEGGLIIAPKEPIDEGLRFTSEGVAQLAGKGVDIRALMRTHAPDDLLGLTVPVGLKRAGREMRMLVENADDQTPADPSLLRIIARAHHVQARLIQNPDKPRHGDDP